MKHITQTKRWRELEKKITLFEYEKTYKAARAQFEEDGREDLIPQLDETYEQTRTAMGKS